MRLSRQYNAPLLYERAGAEHRFLVEVGCVRYQCTMAAEEE